MGTKLLSPIDIRTGDVVKVPLQKPLTYDGLFDPLKMTTLSNNGETVWAHHTGKSYLSGGPLTGKYSFQGMNFHWGSKDTEGSEHTIDGKMCSFEAQLIFKTIARVPIEGTGDDIDEEPTFEEYEKIAVVALIFRADPRTTKFYNMFSFLSHITFPDKSVMVDKNEFISFQPYMKPDEYYVYTGSLTIPPYTECVDWIVYKDVLPISPSQLAYFRTLRARLGYITKNWTGVQKLNRRPVFYPRSDLMVCPGKATCGCDEKDAVREVLCYQKCCRG